MKETIKHMQKQNQNKKQYKTIQTMCKSKMNNEKNDLKQNEYGKKQYEQ